MKLLTMEIKHFKGTTALGINPEGKNLNIYGDNATGKTTVADAYTWLLTGKDSKGRSKFDIFPKNAPDGTDATVSARFSSQSGLDFSLQRVYKKVFSRKNGEAEQQFKGNTTEYYISGVPKTLKEYTSFVEEYFGAEGRLLLLTDPDYFAGKMDYKERREILLKTFAPNCDDREVIQKHPELAPLDNHISIMTTVSDFAAQLKAERKKINDRLTEIPGRVDENEKSRPVIPTGDSSGVIASLAAKRQQQQNHLIALESGEDISRIRMLLNDKKSERAQAETAYEVRRRDAEKEAAESLKGVRGEIAEMEVKERYLAACTYSRENTILALTADLEKLRDACVKRHAELFSSDAANCPTCGQNLPPEKVEALRKEFNLRKSEDLEQMQKRGAEKKTVLKKLCTQQQKDKSDLSMLRDEMVLAKQVLANLQADAAQNLPPFSETAECIRIDKSIAVFEDKIRALELEKRPAIEKTRQALEAIDSKLLALRERDNATLRNKQIDERVKQLLDEETKLGRQLAEKENLLQLTECFVRLQASDIEEKVNAAFKTVKWRLFEQQINGGSKPCCEATVDGVSYGSNLNTAAKLNAGLSIINTLTAASKLEPLPIFIDNAESVTGYVATAAQMVKLHVSGFDDDLRVEVQSDD